MFIPLAAARAEFPGAGLTLTLPAADQLLLDCHHGDIFVLRATGLTAGESADAAAPGGIRLELTLTPAQGLLAACEEFAAHQQLPLGAARDLPAQLQEQPVLAAVHLPGANLFVYAEQSAFTARALAPDRCEISVAGDFRTRKVPCRETDLVIHLERPAAARLLDFLAGLLRARL